MRLVIEPVQNNFALIRSALPLPLVVKRPAIRLDRVKFRAPEVRA